MRGKIRGRNEQNKVQIRERIEQNKGHVSYKVKKKHVLKRNMCNFCEHVIFDDTSQNLGIFKGVSEEKKKNMHSNVGFMSNLVPCFIDCKLRHFVVKSCFFNRKIRDCQYFKGQSG